MTQEINNIIQNLSMPKDEVRVAIDHANDKNAKKHGEGIKAYAKLAGSNWTFYVKDLKTFIGRPPDPRPTTPSAISPPNFGPNNGVIDIDLGPGKMVSRLHATIEYDMDGSQTWRIVVTGRNGMKIDNEPAKKGTMETLHSGQVLEIAGVQMMFVLPNVEVKIHPSIGRRFHIAEPQEAATYPAPVIPTTPSNAASTSQVAAATQAPQTPARKRSGYGRGMVMESADKIDYSADSAKDIKPNISYALLIAQAILSSPDEQLTLNRIYNFIMTNYAFYRHTNSGWQVRLAHLIQVVDDIH